MILNKQNQSKNEASRTPRSIGDIVHEVFGQRSSKTMQQQVCMVWGQWLLEEPIDPIESPADDLADFIAWCGLPCRYTEEELLWLAKLLIQRGKANGQLARKPDPDAYDDKAFDD